MMNEKSPFEDTYPGPTESNPLNIANCIDKSTDGLPQKTAARAVDAVFGSIAEGLQEDGIVTIGKWGTYSAEEIAGE